MIQLDIRLVIWLDICRGSIRFALNDGELGALFDRFRFILIQFPVRFQVPFVLADIAQDHTVNAIIECAPMAHAPQGKRGLGLLN